MNWKTLIYSDPKIDDGENDRCHGHCSFNCKHDIGNPSHEYDEYENRNPLSRSFELAADVSLNLVETCRGEFYRNRSPYGRACLIEVEKSNG